MKRITLILLTALAGSSVALARTQFNPYLCKVLCPPTLYSSAVHSAMAIGQPSDLSLTNYADKQLATAYVKNPELILFTEADMANEPALRAEVSTPLETEAQLSQQVEAVELGPDVEAEVADPIARKPKFWTVKGDGSVQLTQSHYSDNWYQGGDDNFAEMTSLTLQANYDNKKKLTWDNKLEVQLGLQTNSGDEIHKIKVNTNLLRLTSNLGYEAAKHWSYTASLLTYTQIMKNYNSNAYTYTTAFGTPYYLTLSVGMTYKFASKKDKFTGSLLLAPIAYNMRYVSTDSLRSYHSIPDGKKVWSNFGPSVTLNYKWLVCNNITWEGRMYYYTNLHYALWEWENTFSFTINKYLSAKLFLYPRFDDSSDSYRKVTTKTLDDGTTKEEKGSFFMFREWLSLGLSFSF